MIALYVMSVKTEQPEKAPAPILVTLSGMTIEVILLHPSNAFAPISTTVSGMVNCVIAVQYLNAEFPILVNFVPSSKTTLVMLSSAELVPPKALFPISVTVLGMVMTQSVVKPA